MMTIDDLLRVVIQPKVAKEAYAHAEKRLTDLLETKKSFETRASTLLTVFTTLALALTGAGGAFFTATPLVGHAPKYLPVAFFVASAPLVLAAWTMVAALRPMAHGNLGSAPSMWLEPGVIDASTDVVPAMQAYVTHDMQARIAQSECSNNERARLMKLGLGFVPWSPFLLIIGSLGALLVPA